MQLFLEQGYEATTVRAIGRRARLSDSLLYYYFDSKAAILEALLAEPAWPFPERTIRTLEDLRQLALEQFAAWLDNATLVRLTVREALDGQPIARQFSIRMTALAQRRICEAAAKILSADEATEVCDALDAVRFGAISDALLHAGDQLAEYASGNDYRQWLASLTYLILPPREQVDERRVVPFPGRTVAEDIWEIEDGSHPVRGGQTTVGDGPQYGRGNARTRQRIVRAAAELFAERGFDATSMKAIAARLGLSDAALYYYFRSKYEVLQALWEIPELRRFGSEEGENAPQNLADLIDAVADTLAAQDTVIRLTAVRTLSGDRTARALREYTLARWRRYLLGWLERRTELPEVRRERAAEALTLAFLGTIYPSQIRYGPEAPAYFRSREYRARMLRIAERILGERTLSVGG